MAPFPGCIRLEKHDLSSLQWNRYAKKQKTSDAMHKQLSSDFDWMSLNPI